MHKNNELSFFFEKGSKWRNQVEKSATFGSQQNRDDRTFTLLWILSLFYEVIVDHLLHLYFKSTDLMTPVQDFLGIKACSKCHPPGINYKLLQHSAFCYFHLCYVVQGSLHLSVIPFLLGMLESQSTVIFHNWGIGFIFQLPVVLILVLEDAVTHQAIDVTIVHVYS